MRAYRWAQGLILCLACLLASASAAAVDLWVFTRDGCPPCERLWDALNNQGLANGFELYVIDTTTFPSLAKKHGVSATPTSVLFSGGKEVDRKVGYDGASSYRAWLQKSRHLP